MNWLVMEYMYVQKVLEQSTQHLRYAHMLTAVLFSVRPYTTQQYTSVCMCVSKRMYQRVCLKMQVPMSVCSCMHAGLSTYNVQMCLSTSILISTSGRVSKTSGCTTRILLCIELSCGNC